MDHHILNGLRDSVAEAFKNKVQKVMPWYKYKATDVEHFDKAAEICFRIDADPVSFVDAQFDNVKKIDNFQAAFLHSKYAEEKYKEYIDAHHVQETFVEWYDLYQTQLSYLRNLIQTGMTVEKALMKEYIHFYPWFRILITKKPVPEIINKYGVVAKQELKKEEKNGLIKFLKEKKFDLSRIL